MAFHNIPPNGFPDLPDMEELEAVVKDVNNLSDNKANQITIAPFFNPEASYEVGDLVYYNGLSYRCTNDHEGEWDEDDFAATTVSGELATLKNGLTSLNSHRIELETFNTGTNAQTLSFAGTAHCRRANMLLLLSTQGMAVPPIVVGFTGASQGYETILSVYVSANDVGVTASGSSISIPAELSSYGAHTIVKLYPDDDITITVSQ